MPSRIAFVVALLALSRPAPADPPPWHGVFKCYGPEALSDGEARPAPGFDFALLDDAVYANSAGSRGRYKLTGNGLMTMMSGPLSGKRYQQTSPLTFRALDIGGPGQMDCSLNPNKDPDRPGW